jgi:hypothetical protein
MGEVLHEMDKLICKEGINVPVVLIIFNRPDMTEKVFAEIARIKPRKLLVIADGPRKDYLGEMEKCAAARAIIERVDWKCEIYRNYSERNMRGPWRISSGLDWVFSIVDEAIILEDDTLPTQSFFPYCQKLLKRYRDDERIMHISGNNFLFDKIKLNQDSYYFSKYTFTWGWATWKRAWDCFDISLRTWPYFKSGHALDFISDSRNEKRYWRKIFEDVYSGDSVHWDYAWLYALWSHGGLSIIPRTNLVSNIGFGKYSTHTLSKHDQKADMKTIDIWELYHPNIFIRNIELDRVAFSNVFKQKNYLLQAYIAIKERRFSQAVINKLKSWTK